jgi:hypothetical protein
MSVIGCDPSSASTAASAIDAPSASAFSVALVRIGRVDMFASATRASHRGLVHDLLGDDDLAVTKMSSSGAGWLLNTTFVPSSGNSTVWASKATWGSTITGSGS